MAYQKIYMNQIHSSSLLCQLSQMWQRDILCDAVIYAGTTAVKVHRVVLVAACPMLQSMDGSDAGNKLEVKLSQDIKLESITEFLRYLYDGFMMLTEDNVKDIEKIGRLLQVDSVTKCCADFFKVLQTQAGQNTSYNPQFSFHADQAEFRHVRASDLLRSMQNGIEKRSSEGDIASSRKKAKKSNEDMFEVMQVDTGKGNAGSRVCQSLAVSVASRSEPSETSVQVIDAAQGVKSKQPVVLESKTSTNKSQDERNIGRPMVSLLSGAKAAKSLNLTPSSANSEQPFTQLSKAKKSSQRSSTKTRPDDKDTDEQILIKPIGDEGIFMAEALTTEPSSLTSPVEFDTELNGEDPDRGAATVSLEDTGQADSKQLSAAGLSVVKIEKLNTDDSTYMGQFEDYCYAEDDGSDTEAVYDDEAGLGTSDGPTWYIQTFKDKKTVIFKEEPPTDSNVKENRRDGVGQNPVKKRPENVKRDLRVVVKRIPEDDVDKSSVKQSQQYAIKQDPERRQTEKFIVEQLKDGKVYHCNTCKYSTNYKSNMTRHIALHHEKKDDEPKPKDILCSECGLTFVTRYGLSLHRNNKHDIVFKIRCKICQKGFNIPCIYRKHMLAHKRREKNVKRKKPVRNSADKFECDHEGCKKMFETIKGMREHKLGVHGGRKFFCHLCDKAFLWRSCLRYHTKNSHKLND